MAIKHSDPYRKTILDYVTFVMYFSIMFFGIPTLLFYMLVTFSVAFWGGQSRAYTPFILLTLTLIAIIFIYKQIGHTYKKRTNALIKNFRCDLAFDPIPENEFYGHDEYIGIDTSRGTIVYIAHPRSNIFSKDVLLMAFDSSNWKSIELTRTTIPSVTIRTNASDIPHVTFTNRKAPRIFDMIDSMRGKNYQYDVSNPGYVEYKAEQAAADHGFNLILPRS